jgi:branched-chain amino acid transport system permease protein
VLAATALAIVGLYLFFTHTLRGKALQATAINRVGAQLMGIRSNEAGSQAFFLSAMIGGLSGLLIAPITTIFYDTGFLIGLKGFVAAIVGGLFSYPLAAMGALLVGLIEAFASFWASAFKEVLVFTLILPVLLWRSLRAHHSEEDEE